MPGKNGYFKLPPEETSVPLDRQKTSVWHLLFFLWMNDIFKTGGSRPLEQFDLLPIKEQNKTRILTENLKKIWYEEKKACFDRGKTPRLWRCVAKMLPAKEVLLMILFGMVAMIGGLLRCLLLGVILSNLTSSDGDKTVMYICAVLIGVVSMVERTSTHTRSWMSESAGARIACALKGIIYSKVTLVGRETLQQFQEGHVIDLLSNDIQGMELAPRWLFDIVSLVYYFPVVLYLFLNLFRWEALAGILFLVGLVPYYLCASYRIGSLRLQTLRVSDRRIAVMNELVCGIRAVKTQAWEHSYEEIVKDIRRQEISKIRQKNLVMSITEAITTSSSSTAVFLSVLFLVTNHWLLSPVDAFMVLSFMKLLKLHLSIFLGKGLELMSEAIVSLNRIEEFLLLDELPSSRDGLNVSDSFPEDQKTLTANEQAGNALWQTKDQSFKDKANKNEDKNNEQVSSAKDIGQSLVVCNLNYKINTQGEKNILSDVSFIAPRESLTIICGRVGSGKSTLLSAIAGEVKWSSGNVHRQGTLAYVTQVPWVFSGTVKENILFNEPYDPERYSTVVEACALKDDIELFPKKHDTLVGQRGVVLSGGQRARVSLARAVYSCADVYILDDPLSAVDQKVGDEIFGKCICGLLSDKIRVLVSQHRRYLQAADEIVILDNGHVVEKRKPQMCERDFSDNIVPNTSSGRFQAELEPIEKSKGLEIPDEDRAIGSVSFQLYWDYFKSGIHPRLLVAFVAFFLFTQPALIFPDVWLSYLSKRTLEQQQKMDYMVIYAGAIATSLVLITIRVFLFFTVSLRSSQRLHDRMVEATLHARLSFFDTNPAGRILNRFSRDIGSIDEELPQIFIVCIQITLIVISASLLPAISNPWLLFIFFPTTAAFIMLGRYYLKTSRELKRLESICRSPVFSHFSETMDGLDTIRPRRMQQNFIDKFYSHQDLHNQALYMVIASTRWFGLRVDLLCVPFITCVALASVGFSMPPAIAGLSLSYVMETLDYTQYAVRTFSEVENLMTSMERVITYTNLESEPGYKTKALPTKDWPRDGHVTLRNVTMTYYEGGPQVLKNLNISIEGKSRIGVVGRTGAGKSSFVAALLRMPDAQGDIIIDGVRINDINLKESRRCISVLRQVPVIFSGSLRRNLDPMNHHEDIHLWSALEDVQLKSFVENLNGQLEYELLERGANLSVGERQLVCLARTLLQDSRIVILDEPTAHVDPVTEQTIWKTVHEKLHNCTVITIAHRLDTIKTCDTILVMREGEIAEFGTFDSLMGRESDVLATIVQTISQ